MNDETIKLVADVLAKLDARKSDIPYDEQARLVIEAMEEMGWGPDEWPEPRPNSVFKAHTTTSIPIDNLWVDIVTADPDPKP